MGISAQLSNPDALRFAFTNHLFAFYFLLKFDDRADQCLRARGTTLYVYINRYNPVYTLYHMITMLPVRASAVRTGAH